MWFKSKPRNRRLGREFVLDVKLRSSKVRATRMRMAAISLGVVFTSVLTVYFVCRGAGYLLDRLVYENTAFAIREIDVQTDGAIPVDKLQRWTGVNPGDNLLALDLVKVKQRLEMASVIESASIERILPHTLRVRVLEREAIAQLSVFRPRPISGLDRHVYQLDANGWVMLPLEAPRSTPGATNWSELLPVIYGLNATEVQAGRRIALPQLQSALGFLSTYLESPMQSIVEVKRIDISTPDVLTVITAQGSEIVFGLSNFEQQLRRWHAIYLTGRKLSKAIGTLDLAVTNNIPVCWLEGIGVPQSTPKPIKPPRTKKRHV